MFLVHIIRRASAINHSLPFPIHHLSHPLVPSTGSQQLALQLSRVEMIGDERMGYNAQSPPFQRRAPDWKVMLVCPKRFTTCRLTCVKRVWLLTEGNNLGTPTLSPEMSKS